MTFNAKNLTYDKNEPAFLQRLKAGYAAQDGRNNIQHARPGKSRLKMGDGDDDDGPVILDESGEVVEKGVYEGMLKGEKVGDEGEDVGKLNGQDSGAAVGKLGERGGKEDQGGEREKQTVADVGIVKKRKVVKVVGVEDEEERVSSDTKRSAQALKSEDTKKTRSEKSKKKAKKIKLSFDNPE